MTGAVIILIITVVAGIILAILDHRHLSSKIEDDEDNNKEENPTQEEGCCGLHITCEKDSLSPFTTEIEYYDDEELDRFRGRQPDEYTDEEIEEIRDVLLTLRVEEIAGWSRSLQVRGIELPEILREELLLVVSEARKRK